MGRYPRNRKYTSIVLDKLKKMTFVYFWFWYEPECMSVFPCSLLCDRCFSFWFVYLCKIAFRWFWSNFHRFISSSQEVSWWWMVHNFHCFVLPLLLLLVYLTLAQKTLLKAYLARWGAGGQLTHQNWAYLVTYSLSLSLEKLHHIVLIKLISTIWCSFSSRF